MVYLTKFDRESFEYLIGCLFHRVHVIPVGIILQISIEIVLISAIRIQYCILNSSEVHRWQVVQHSWIYFIGVLTSIFVVCWRKELNTKKKNKLGEWTCYFCNRNAILRIDESGSRLAVESDIATFTEVVLIIAVISETECDHFERIFSSKRKYFLIVVTEGTTPFSNLNS